MYVKTKPTSSFFQPNSPTFCTQASTEMRSPGVASLSSSHAGKFLSSPLAASPERRLAKSDIIYLSRSELERELHGFVDLLVQDKAVDENDTTQYLEHLKRLVINLIKENTRLQSTPQSARKSSESPYASNNGEMNQRLEDFDREKMVYEEKIKNHSLYIIKLEDKVNDLVKQCQGLMKINYELSSQMVQGSMSPIPPILQSFNISREPDSAERGFGTPKKYSIEQVAQLIGNEQGLLADENDQLKQEVNGLKEVIFRLEHEKKDAMLPVLPNEKSLVQENIYLRKETNDLRETVSRLEQQLMRQQAPQTQYLATESTQLKQITKLTETDKYNMSQATNEALSSLANLQEENNKLKEELKKKENTIMIVTEEREALKAELNKSSKRLNTEDEFRSRGGEDFYVLSKSSVLGEEAPKENRRTDSSMLMKQFAEEGSKTLRERNLTPSMNNVGDEGSKSFREGNVRLTQPELLRKQLGDYKAANAILHKKVDRYLLQIGDLNETLKTANENLDKIQNRCITLEKELINKNKLETIIGSHISLINKLEVMIHSLRDDNLLLQQANEENMLVITELKAQIDEAGTHEKSEVRFFTPPRSSRRLSSEPSEHVGQAEGQTIHSARSPARSPDSRLLERDFVKRKYEEKVKGLLHEKEVELRTERIKHKNQIEKYNMNLEILSKKIKSLVTVNEDLGKDLEILKVEFANYRTVSWSVIQEVRKCLDNFKKHDHLIEKGISKLETRHGEISNGELREAYEGLKKDILDVNDVVEERRKYL